VCGTSIPNRRTYLGRHFPRLLVRVEERHRDGESGEKKQPLLVVYGQCISYIWYEQTETATFIFHQGNTRAISESERRTVRGLQTSKETKEVSIHDTELFRSKHV
jgi:hypothetical protein